MYRKEISNYKPMALVEALRETTASSDHIRLWFLPVKGIANKDTGVSHGPITNYLPVDRNQSSLTISEVIVQAQNILGISKQHLAVVFATSRQNLYNLLKNSEQVPTQETDARAMQVKNALDVIFEICPNKLGASTMTCRINGRRLLDELSENTIDLDQVRIFAHEIYKRILEQQESNLPESVIKNQDFIDTFNAV